MMRAPNRLRSTAIAAVAQAALCLLGVCAALLPLPASSQPGGSAADPATATALAPEPASARRSARSVEFAERDMVVAAHPLAVDAGVAMLARGGSAVDAAIATQMVLNLVEPQSSGIGGGGFLLHYRSDDAQMRAYDGRETAPAAATADLLRAPDGSPLPRMRAIDGGLSVGTPGLLRMLELAHRAHGRLPWADLFGPAIRLADEGFEISPRMATAITAAAARICAQPAARAWLLQADACLGKPAGTRLRNPAFAATLTAIARDGADALYQGPIAAAIVEAVRTHPSHPGLLTAADLAGYRARVRAPVCGWYRGLRICGVPPPSAGTIAVLQTLGMLERFDLRALAPESSDAVHLMSEALRLAHADRARHVADDDFVAVPVAGLLDPGYLAARAALIRTDRSLGAVSAGMPQGALAHGNDDHRPLPSTTHLSVIDSRGNAVSLTSSIENGFGSLQMAAGFLLNNQLTDFAFLPTDADGRPVANRVEAGKRPRSTMSPLMVFGPDGRLLAVLGSPGGLAIAGYLAKTLSAMIDHDRSIQQAIDAPNLVADTTPATWIERGSALESMTGTLTALGHRVVPVDLSSGVHGIVAGTSRWAGIPPGERAPGAWAGGADPRREGVARGSASDNGTPR